MENNFQKINSKKLKFNAFELLDNDWMLVTAGVKDRFNTMTASWGGFGILWNKAVAFVFIRPTRFTFQFSEKYDDMTLSFFTEQYREELKYCGANSGKEVDKVEKCGFTLFETESGAISFNEARLILECKKLSFQDINPENFLDMKLNNIYPKKDYHRMYICEITSCYVKKQFYGSSIN